MEAEAQCAFLDITSQTEGTITDDSDIWLFGGRRMYKNFFNQSKYVEMYSLDNIHNHFGLSRDQLINLALLCGSDYTEGIQGVGPVRALEIMAEFPGDGLDGLKMFRKWWEKAKKKASSESKLRNRLKELKLNSGFPSEAVVWAYLNPKVDESKERFTWRLPEVDLLREFAKIKFGWPKEKTDQALLPMMKQLTQKEHQRRISSYFQPENFIQTSKIKSQRLKKALDLVKNPQAAIELEKDSSVDNEVCIKKNKLVEKKAKVGQNAEESEQLMSGTAKKKSKSQKVIKIQKKAKNTSVKKNTTDMSVSESETCSIKGMATDETADNFMFSMTQKVHSAKTELAKRQKTGKVRNQKKQDPNTGPAVGKMLVSLDQAKPHKVCGRKVANKGKAIKSGAIYLSESSSCSEIESDDQLNSLVSEADEMNDARNLKPHSFTKIVEGSLNKQPKRFQSTQNNIEGLQSDQQLLKSCNETDPQTTRKMSYSEDLSQGTLKAASSMPAALAASMKSVDGLEGICRADVSVINRQNLPETLAYLNQRSKEDTLILRQLKGGQILNAVERRMEADEKKTTKVNVHSSSATDALTFEDLLEKMDTAATETQRFNKKRSLYIPEYSHAAQEKSKRIENKIEMVKASEKVESPVTKAFKKLSKKVGFGSSDESFDDLNRSHELNVASPSENTFKTKRARQFDQPIGETNDDFSSTKKSSKKNKFRQQLKHLNDTRSIRGHGILPYSGKNEFIKGNAFVGKGKGRGKNTQEVSPSADEKDNAGYGQGLNEYETLTEADLGSDFSECDF
ncbi:DNA repair protein [Bulinus truncatus]|nr:DNA repair protein [Bulinus truncatus]